jgi:hypothetical protein
MFSIELPAHRKQIVNVLQSWLKHKLQKAICLGEIQQLDGFVEAVEGLNERIDFLEARNKELQVNNEQQRQRALAAERAYASAIWANEHLAGGDSKDIVSLMLTEAADYFAGTLTKADEKAWRHLLVYCPLDVLEDVYDTRADQVAQTPSSGLSYKLKVGATSASRQMAQSFLAIDMAKVTA